MKPNPAFQKQTGMTVIEMSLTMALLMGVAGIMLFSLSGYREWKLGKNAATTLRSVYLAQKTFLSDRPTTRASDLEASDLLPYLPGDAVAVPTVESLDGNSLAIDFQVIPPVISGGYDPSGKSDDGIWDVGKL